VKWFNISLRIFPIIHKVHLRNSPTDLSR